MFKKVLASFAVCLLLGCPMTLVGCKKDKNNNQNSNPPSTTPGDTTPAPAPTPSNPVVTIAIDGNLKDDFYKGESLNIEGINVFLTYQDATTETIVLSNNMISGFDTSTTGEKTLTITYEGKTFTHDYSVHEVRATNIEIETPFKTNYYTGSVLDITGGKFNATYENGTTETIDVTADMISNFDTSEAGEFALTLTHAEYSIVIDYTVSDAQLTTISIKSQFKTEYFEGEDLDITGGTLTATYEDGNSETIAITLDMIGETFSSETAGSKIMTITYKGKSTEVPYKINAIDIVAISVASTLDKTEYFEGEDLDITGGTIRLIYNNGDTEIIPITNAMISGFNKQYTGENEKTLSITYWGFTTSLKYKTLKVSVTSLTLTNTFKTEYFVDDYIDVTGGKLTATYNNGAIKTDIALTTDMISNFDTTEAGAFEMTIEYDDFQIKQAYTVEGIELESIELTANPTKTTYYVGDEKYTLDVSGAQITLYYSNGTTEVVTLKKANTKFRVTGFDTNEIAENKIMTIEHIASGLTTTCTYSVVAAPEPAV